MAAVRGTWGRFDLHDDRSQSAAADAPASTGIGGLLMNTTAVRRLSRLIMAATGCLVVTTAMATSASARTPIDPSTLNPAPPASFNAVCYRDGSHIRCDLAFRDPDITNDPSGIICAGTELLISQSRSVVGQRTYDANGNLLQRHFREYLQGTFSNPDTGKVALWTQHDTVIQNLAVPGDLTTGTEQISGQQSRIWLPDGGTILTDAGYTLVDAASGAVLQESAHHPFDAYFGSGDTSALTPLCAALD